MGAWAAHLYPNLAAQTAKIPISESKTANSLHEVALMESGKYEASDRSTAGVAVTFFMIGLGAGALIGLMYAPKAGKQFRRDLRRKYDGAVETFEDWTEEAKERAGDAMEFAEEIRDAAREKVAPFAKAVRGK